MKKVFLFLSLLLIGFAFNANAQDDTESTSKGKKVRTLDKSTVDSLNSEKYTKTKEEFAELKASVPENTGVSAIDEFMEVAKKMFELSNSSDELLGSFKEAMVADDYEECMKQLSQTFKPGDSKLQELLDGMKSTIEQSAQAATSLADPAALLKGANPMKLKKNIQTAKWTAKTVKTGSEKLKYDMKALVSIQKLMKEAEEEAAAAEAVSEE